jgi:hypothetical protein
MVYHRLTLPSARAKLDELAKMPHQPTRLTLPMIEQS